MSETTQILFNSPALRSLKRDQLVKLCKTHSLKANGKNVELIERLKAHAVTLPLSEPLSVATRSESEDESMDDEPKSPMVGSGMPRPSEQWEVVMGGIKEVPEGTDSQPGTLNSVRSVGKGAFTSEFGTESSKGAFCGRWWLQGTVVPDIISAQSDIVPSSFDINYRLLDQDLCKFIRIQTRNVDEVS